jgi:hypothetical protein
MNRRPSILIALVVLASVGVLAGCTDPYAHTAPASAGQEAGSPGEPTPPPPTRAGTAQAADVQPTPQAALERFASLYSNWTYRTLARNQQTLAAISVGPARLAEQQAAATSRTDSTIRRAHVANHGQLLAISPAKRRPGWWVIVTREQTTGSGEYEALPANDHVTLAQVSRVRGGWAVQQWQPQD